MASSISDGAYGYSDQQYQAGYYGDAQQYQAAEFNVPPGADAGLQSGYAGGSSNDYPGSSSGLAFPADYGVGDSTLQGDPQLPWQQQQQQPGGSSTPPAGVYDDLDDW